MQKLNKNRSIFQQFMFFDESGYNYNSHEKNDRFSVIPISEKLCHFPSQYIPKCRH